MLKSEGERLQYAAEGPLTTEMDKGFVDHIKSALLASFYSIYSLAAQSNLKVIVFKNALRK